MCSEDFGRCKRIGGGARDHGGLVPMTAEDHRTGSFEQAVGVIEETLRQQKEFVVRHYG
ncbi:MAG: hypothetical protein NZ733_01685 [Aigarchaeota archaeon]|nr:hypothetical protein [Aigarchaeota archaeon]MCX8202872.1 hypothetical protein [Nitrososphaeria archaeon]MDW8044045.1 hypothetical protein [Nitrososphaerota archaeon]